MENLSKTQQQFKTRPTHISQVRSIQESGWVDSDMVGAHRSGLIMQCMKVTGYWDRHMGKADFNTLMETLIMGNIEIIKRMGMVYMLMQMENTKEVGVMISSMEKGLKHFKTDHLMKVIM